MANSWGGNIYQFTKLRLEYSKFDNTTYAAIWDGIEM
jgi:hypothetical protein